MKWLHRLCVTLLVIATSDALLADRVRITLNSTATTALSLSQVVILDDNGINVALGGICAASSFYDFMDSRGVSKCDMALDDVRMARDNPDPFYQSDFSGSEEFWEIDLVNTTDIDSIVIYNREGNSSSWLMGASIEVLNVIDAVLWSDVLTDDENQTFIDLTQMINNNFTATVEIVMKTETIIPDTPVPETLEPEPFDANTSAPEPEVQTDVPFPDPVPMEEPVAPVLQETKGDDSIWVVLGVFVAVICFGMMTAVVFAARHWYTSKKHSKEMMSVNDRLRDSTAQQEDLSKKLASIKDNQETYKNPSFEANQQNSELSKLQNESQANQQQYEDNVKELTSEIRELEMKVADLVNTQQTTDNKIHEIATESNTIREKATAAAEAAIQEKQAEIASLQLNPPLQPTNGTAPAYRSQSGIPSNGVGGLVSNPVGISSLDSITSPLQSQPLGTSPLLGGLRTTGFKSSLFSSGTQPFSQFSTDNSISAPLLSNAAGPSAGLISAGSPLQHGVSRSKPDAYVPPNPLKLDAFGLPVVPPPDTPLPPQLWVYQQQVNPDVHKRKHAFHVYKKRHIQISQNPPQGHVLEVSAKRIDGSQECEERIPASLINSVSGDGTTMPELNIALLIETKNNQRLVFIVSTESDRTAWLQWFSRMYPTTSTDVPVS